MKLSVPQKIRDAAIAAVFCVVCLIFLGRMVTLQITGRDRYEDIASSTTTTQYVTVQAVRGEIYDRNGKKLVGNQYSYDLVLDYYTLPATRREENAEMLRILELMRASGSPYEATCSIVGTWEHPVPEMDGDSYARLCTVLGLADGTPFADFFETFSGKYLPGIEEDEADEAARLALASLRCDLLLGGFGTKTLQFTLATSVDGVFVARVKENCPTGVTFATEVSRVYLYPGYASHILGTVGKIYSETWSYYSQLGYSMNALVGNYGCEAAFEKTLRGTDGKIKIVLDSFGSVIERTVVSEPVAGKDVYLTIDIDLQIAAEQGLAEGASAIREKYETDCYAGALVAENPNTGEVLAMASYPSYDLSTYNQAYSALSADAQKPLLNRATSEIYTPGSTFKLCVATAGLETGAIDASTVFTCRGSYNVGGGYAPKCTATHGVTNVIKAIRVSCNCFFYQLGEKLGIDVIDRFAEAFGLGKKTGLEIPEAVGILASPSEYPLYHEGESFGVGQTVQAAIGQSDNSFTPAQICNYVSTLLNGGTLRSLHLLGCVKTFSGEAVETVTPTVVSEAVLSDATLAIIKEGMREVVNGNAETTEGNEQGTGYTFIKNLMKDLPVTVGGKTGTAQTGNGENALFVCAAPYDNPDITVVCVMEQGASGQYASIAASRVLHAYYSNP